MAKSVTRGEAIGFLECACRNWAHVPKLSEEDIGDVATELLRLIIEKSTSGGFDLRVHLERQREWSSGTFGPGPRTAGVIDHIRKELCEIEEDPSDITEWIDVVILALDGAWRAGYQPQQIIDAMVGKQIRNEGRAWPDWRTMPADKAIEHVRSGDTPAHGVNQTGGSSVIGGEP